MSDPYRDDEIARDNRMQTRGNTGLIFGLVLAALVIIGGLMYAANNSNMASNTPSTTTKSTTTGAANMPSDRPLARPEPSGTPPAPVAPPRETVGR